MFPSPIAHLYKHLIFLPLFRVPLPLEGTEPKRRLVPLSPRDWLPSHPVGRFVPMGWLSAPSLKVPAVQPLADLPRTVGPHKCPAASCTGFFSPPPLKTQPHRQAGECPWGGGGRLEQLDTPASFLSSCSLRIEPCWGGGWVPFPPFSLPSIPVRRRCGWGEMQGCTLHPPPPTSAPPVLPTASPASAQPSSASKA